MSAKKKPPVKRPIARKGEFKAMPGEYPHEIAAAARAEIAALKATNAKLRQQIAAALRRADLCEESARRAFRVLALTR